MMGRGFMLRVWRALRSTGGTAAIEFAFAIPIFVFIWMGVAEFGRVMWIRNTLQTATEEAARYAMTHTSVTNSTLITMATSSFEATGNTSAVFTVARDVASGVNFVTINGTYTFATLFSILNLDGVHLEGKSRVPLIS